MFGDFHRVFAFASLYNPAMGQMKRAEERERQRREQMGQLFRVVISWRVDGPKWLVDFTDPRTGRTLTRQRTYKSAEPIRGLVARSMTTLVEGPRKITFGQNLAKGFGEIEVDVSAGQFERLTSS